MIADEHIATASGRTVAHSLPGDTAAGLAHASQLVNLTSLIPLATDLTAAPAEFFLVWQAPASVAPAQAAVALRGEDYPVLNALWDNDDDRVFDLL